ncbi:MAG: GFA family protein [Pseudomonadota bacterium]
MTKVNQNGSCHCGAVAFTVSFDTEPFTFRCNCSICTKARAWLMPVPASDFVLVRGTEALSCYTFGPRMIQHFFCRHCGVKTHGRGEAEELGGEFVSVNVATLDMAPDALAEVDFAYLNGREDSFQTEPEVTSYL